MNIPKSLVEFHVCAKHPGFTLENRVDLNTVIIIGEGAVHTGEEVARLTALPCSSGRIKIKINKNKTHKHKTKHHNKTKPLAVQGLLTASRQEVTKTLVVHPSPPQGEQDTTSKNHRVHITVWHRESL